MAYAQLQLGERQRVDYALALITARDHDSSVVNHIRTSGG
jgi:hypothetical protein